MTEEQPQDTAKSLGRYSLVHALGQGGMGEVYLAKISGAAGFEKPCIVKTILPSLLSDRQFLDRFHHEAKVLVHLVHSNIAQVYDMGEEAGSYFMALEYVAGVDLSQLLDAIRAQGTQIPIPIALYLGARIAEGLGYAHRKAAPDGTPLGIVHRDISPHNVMVGYEGEVKVIDFGLARSAARSKFTLPATVMGKLGYMSPEQARAEPLDHRTDIYACGLVVWELLAGRSAFSGGTVGEMMAAMANPRVPLLREVRPEVDPALEAAVAQAIAPDRAQRYTRADEFARKLSEQLIKSGASIGAEEVGEYVRTVCPEAFAAQRKLISKLSTVSTLKRTPIPLKEMSPPPVPSALAGADDDGFGATHVASRSGATVAAVKPSRAPWIVAAVSLALLLAGGGFFAWRSLGAEPPAPPAVAAADEPTGSAPAETPIKAELAPVPAAPPATPSAAEAEPAPVAAASSVAPPSNEAGPAPAPAEVAAAAPEPARKTSPAVEYVKGVKVGALIVDRSGTFVRAGSAEGLSAGSVLQIVGKPGKGAKRRVLGSATVLDVKAKLSRVALDDAAKRAKGAKFVALPSVRVAPAPEESKPVAATSSAPSTPSAAPAPAIQPAVASAAPAGAVVPASDPVVAAAPPVAAAKPAPRRLSGRVTVDGALNKYFVLHNADTTAWTDCTVSIREEGKYPAKYAAGAPIPAGGQREVPLGRFRRDPSARLVAPNMVGLTCAEGSVDLPAKW